MADDEKYKLGELTADMAAVKGDVLEIKVTQKEIIQKLDSINAVSVERWEKRNKYVDSELGDIKTRLDAIEDDKKLELNSAWYKIRLFVDSAFVKLFGAAIFGVILVAFMYYAQKIIETIEYEHLQHLAR